MKTDDTKTTTIDIETAAPAPETAAETAPEAPPKAKATKKVAAKPVSIAES